MGITCVSAIDLDHSFVTSWRYFTTLPSYEPKHKIKIKKGTILISPCISAEAIQPSFASTEPKNCRFEAACMIFHSI